MLLGSTSCSLGDARRRCAVSSTGGTGLTRKSATRICIRRRATVGVERRRHGNQRRPITNTHHQLGECLKLRLVAGNNIDNDDTGAGDVDIACAC
jgi:hypothetical protein